MKILVAVLLVALSASAQNKHDPLNAREVDQMRDSAQDPKKRVDLLLSFASERILAIERLHASAKPSERDADTIANLLTDLAGLVDELDDNLSMYNGHSEDLRRPLRHVLETEAEFQKKLAELDEGSTPSQKRRFAIALADAADSVKTSSESARVMLADQINKKGELKGKEKDRPRDDSRQARSGKDHPGPEEFSGSRQSPPEQ